MTYEEALAAIQETENGAALAAAITGRVSGLETAKADAVRTEKQARAQRRAYADALADIGKQLGLEGDTETILAGGEDKAREIASKLKTSDTSLKDWEKRATTAEDELASLKRQGQVLTLAEKAGANATVFEQLLGDRLDKVTTTDDGVLLDGKPLKDAIAADEELKVFAPALFPSAASPTPAPSPSPTPAPKTLPKTPPGDGDSKTFDPVASHVKRRRISPETLKN
ncbi:MAG: hypothetical protein AAFY74_20365 [Pseudomonadota bacterium]